MKKFFVAMSGAIFALFVNSAANAVPSTFDFTASPTSSSSADGVNNAQKVFAGTTSGETITAHGFSTDEFDFLGLIS